MRKVSFNPVALAEAGRHPDQAAACLRCGRADDGAGLGRGTLSFQSAEHGVERIAQREVPLMTEALRLSVMSGEISAAAARFVSADNVRDQRQIATQIEDRSMQLRMLIDKVRAGSSQQSFGAVDIAARQLESNLSDLDIVMVGRSSLRAQLDRELDKLHQLHTRIADELTPIVDKSYYEAVSKAENIGKIGDQTVKTLVDDGMQRMQKVVQIGTETNLVTGLLDRERAHQFAGHPRDARGPLHRLRAPCREAAHGAAEGPTNTIRCASALRPCSSSPISGRRASCRQRIRAPAERVPRP